MATAGNAMRTCATRNNAAGKSTSGKKAVGLSTRGRSTARANTTVANVIKTSVADMISPEIVGAPMLYANVRQNIKLVVSGYSCDRSDDYHHNSSTTVNRTYG